MRTSNSTQEISKMVSDIQSMADKASSSIHDNANKMVDLSEKTSAVENILRDITKNVDDVNVQILQIAAAAEEQTTATSEISNNIQNVTTVAQTIANDVKTSMDLIEDNERSLENLKDKLAFFTLAK